MACMSADPGAPVLDIKARLGEADSVVDALPWRLGASERQRKQSRGRVAALAHQVAALLAGGWNLAEVRTVLATAEGAAEAPDAAAQEKRWRAALKRANNARRHRADTTGPVLAGAEPARSA